MIARWVVLGVASGSLVTAAWAVGDHRAEFPHPQHESVFPLCSGCHTGIETGVAGDVYPEPADCRNCHDGVTEQRIDWEGPTPRASNLAFDHVRHVAAVAEAGESATSCLNCHRDPEGEGRMAVAFAQPEACVTCHENASQTHLDAGADCRLCHQALVAATALDMARVDAFPQPPSHADSGFVGAHAPTPDVQASCAVCHARNSCERCHVNAEAVPAIAALEPDPRVAALVRNRAPEYPTPASHAPATWMWDHADATQAPDAGCANCHTQASCRACHGPAGPPAVAALPTAPPQDTVRGVQLAGVPVVHPPGFATAHGTAAAIAEQTCTACHTEQDFCLDCHRGPTQPVYHRDNFRERHSADAYGREADCRSCHNTEVFCRSCHAGSGLASEGQLDVAFHTSRPFWLLGHGQAARQGLESCTTCHAQNDCMQCHSAVGAWRINPHGPNFDPRRTQGNNRITCLACHGRRVPG